MGKPIIAQRKGKGSPAYSSPSHRFFGKIAYPRILSTSAQMRGQVVKFIDDPGHGPLLAEILLENKTVIHILAPEGMARGSEIKIRGTVASQEGENAAAEYSKTGEASASASQSQLPPIGSVVPISILPEGTPVYNIELRPGDGGKICRASGTVGYITGKNDEKKTVDVRLASRAVKTFLGRCLATIGVASGGGKGEKPFKTAGNHGRAMLAKGREWPHVRRGAMSAYNHPFGGKSFGKPSTVARSTPPGRKVGHIAARRTGRKRGAKSEDTK